MANLALAIVLAVVWAIQAFFAFYQGNLGHSLKSCQLTEIRLDWSSSRVMASIESLLPDNCMVLRDSRQQRVAGSAIVPGDVVYIKSGDKLSADVRFIDLTADAQFDRSMLTGIYTSDSNSDLRSAYK